MIDYHTHILPGMDDGSRSVEESLSMLREEARQGVKTVVLTPHFYAQQNDIKTYLHRRQQAWERLEPALEPGLPRLLLGAEVQYFEGITHVEELPLLCTQGTNLLLLEMPFMRWSDRMISDAIDLNDQGRVQIILAHIERYLAMQPRGICEVMHRNGLLIQSNAAFFTDWRTRHRARTLVRRGLVQLLGSDCHNLTRRPPNLSAGYELLGKDRDLLLENLLD